MGSRKTNTLCHAAAGHGVLVPIKKVRAVLFDYDQTLSHDPFFGLTMDASHPVIIDWIQKNVFGDKEYVGRWMMNEVNSRMVCERISREAGITVDELWPLFRESVARMRLVPEVLEMVRELKARGIKLGVVSDNMDVFDEIIVPAHGLDQMFDVLVNSANHGQFKKDEGGKLFDLALQKLEVSIGESMLVDDSAGTCQFYREKGGQAFHYQKNPDDLKAFLQANGMF